MSTDRLRAVRDAALACADRPGVHRYDDFVLYHGMGASTRATLLARGAAGKARETLRRRDRRAAARH